MIYTERMIYSGVLFSLTGIHPDTKLLGRRPSRRAGELLGESHAGATLAKKELMLRAGAGHAAT